MHYHVKEIDPLPLTSFCCYSVCSHAAVLVQLMEINCFFLSLHHWGASLSKNRSLPNFFLDLGTVANNLYLTTLPKRTMIVFCFQRHLCSCFIRERCETDHSNKAMVPKLGVNYPLEIIYNSSRGNAEPKPQFCSALFFLWRKILRVVRHNRYYDLGNARTNLEITENSLLDKQDTSG